MYVLYCNALPAPPDEKLDTESVANGWREVMQHTHKRKIVQHIAKMAHFGTNPYKRYRIFACRKGNTIIGRLILKGAIDHGAYTVERQ